MFGMKKITQQNLNKSVRLLLNGMFDFFIAVLVSLFVIVEPIGNIVIFNSLLEKCSEEQKIKTIKKSIIIAFAVLLIFSFGGNAIFQFFNIEMYSFKIAGGILLFIIAVEMMFGMKTRTEYSKEDVENAKKLEEIATMPMAIPLLTGPGAITTGIILANSAATTESKTTFVLAAIIVFFASYLILTNSTKFFNFLKEPRTAIINRIMGLLLAAIAVQFVTNGIMEFIKVI